jgi:hypothetical protein
MRLLLDLILCKLGSLRVMASGTNQKILVERIYLQKVLRANFGILYCFTVQMLH